MKRNAKLSQSEPILGFTPAVDEKTEEKSQVKSAWGEKSNNVSSQRRSGRSAPRMPQMKLGNLLPRLDYIYIYISSTICIMYFFRFVITNNL